MVLFARSDTSVSETGTARIALAFPDDSQPEILPEFHVDLVSGQRMRGKLNFAGIRLKGEGEYRFQIQASDGNGKWNLLFEVPLQIDFQMQD
jgi:hypothetical protein